MKNIYNAPNKEAAATELDNLEKKWEESIHKSYFHGETTGMI